MKCMYLSIVAVVAAFFAVFNSMSGHIEDASLIVSFLGILVTMLVGLNIVQYIFAEKRMKEIAEQSAHEASLDVITTFKIENIIKDAKTKWSLKQYLSAIDCVFNSFEQILLLKEPEIQRYETIACSQLLREIFEESRDKGGLWILEGKRTRYESLLQALSEASQPQCIDLLHQAEEHPLSDDGKFWDGTMVVRP